MFSDPTPITILQTLNNLRLCKTFTTEGKQDFDNAARYSHLETAIHDIDELSLLLRDLETHPDKCIIRGKIRPEYANTSPVKRTLHDIEETGQKAYFQDQPLRWIHIDIDKVPVPDDLPLEAVPEALVKMLPLEFHNASYHYQHSASAGTKSGIASLHLWFMLSTPFTSAELKDWHAHLSTKHQQVIDPAMLREVQANYTANPIFQGVPDPINGNRSGLVKKLLPVVLLNMDNVKKAQMKAMRQKAKIQHQPKNHLQGDPMNYFHKKVSDIGVNGNIPILNAFSAYKWACQTKGIPEDPQWAMDQVRQHLIGTTYNKPPYNTSAWLNNQYRHAHIFQK